MLSFCFRYLRNYDQIRDAVQESLFKAFIKFHQFDEKKASFKTWVYTILRNTCINYLREGRRKPFIPVSTLQLNYFLPDREAIEPLDQMVADEQTYILQEALGSLSEENKRIIKFEILSGFSNKASAKAFNMTHDGYRARLYRIRKELRGNEKLARYYIDN